MRTFAQHALAGIIAATFLVTHADVADSRVERMPRGVQVSVARDDAPTRSTVTWSVKGANIESGSSTEFGTGGFASSLWALHAAGANSVKLVVRVFQPTVTSAVLSRGPLTPTDAALTSAIKQGTSLGMTVTVALHAEVVPNADGTSPWRAAINPTGTSRAAWFGSYKRWLLHYAALAEANGAGTLSIGTEMISTTGPSDAPTWIRIIAALRQAAPRTKLMYEAQWNETTWHANDPAVGYSIGFDKYLDYIGVGAYVPLQAAGQPYSATFARQALATWDSQRIAPLITQFHKPIVLTEVGYNSAPNSLIVPSDYTGASTVSDQVEQANGYKALMSYWSSSTHISGVYFWEWTSNPSAGGSGDPNFTPQNKLAEGVIRSWWGVPATYTAWWPTAQSSLNGIQTFKVAVTGWPVGSYTSEYAIDAGPWRSMYAVRTSPSHREAIIDMSTLAVGAHTLRFRATDGVGDEVAALSESIVVVAPSSPAPPTITTWWPTQTSSLHGVQPFKAVVQSMATASYRMFWQVDGGELNPMSPVTDSAGTYQAANVDVNLFSWNGAGPYTITFVAEDDTGGAIALSAPIQIRVT